MNLQQKTILVLLIVFIGLIAIVGTFVSSILLTSYGSLENEYALKDLNQAVGQIRGEANSLADVTGDWGPWDDTYAFANGTYPGYISDNLDPETYANLHLNLVVIADPHGKILYAGAYDLQNRTMVPVPGFFSRSLNPGDPLMMSDPGHSNSGFILLPGGPMMIATRPITRSDGSGTPRGVFIIGRSLNAAEVASIAAITDPSLRIVRVDDPSLPPAILSQLTAGNKPVPEIVAPVNSTTIRESALLTDIYGNNGIVVDITAPRDIYGEGIRTIFQFIAIILLTGLLFGVGSLIFLDKNVLTRIAGLSFQVFTIGRDTDFSRRVEVSGNDELAGLEREINRMLGKIEESHTRMLESGARFRDLSDLLPQVVFEMDLNGKLLYVNKAGTYQFGIDKEKIERGVNIRAYVSPENFEQMGRGLAAVMAGKKSPGETYNLVRADGSLMTAIVSTSLIHKDGNIVGFRGVVVDITERTQLKEQLEESTKLLSGMLEASPVGVYRLDNTGHVMFVNATFSKITGISSEEIKGKYWADILPPEERDRILVDLGDAIRARTMSGSEARYIHPDGSVYWLFGQTVPLFDVAGELGGWVGTITDITERRKMEVALKESEEKYRALTENTPDVLFSTDIDGKVTYVSPQVNQYGFLPDEIVGRSLFDLLHPQDRENVEENFTRELNEHAQSSATFRMPDKWGHIHWFEEKSFLQLDAFGNHQGVYGMFRDITERQRAEEAIELANKKLNLMNNITRHDILNTLTGLLGCVDMANATDSADERTQLLGDIKELARIIQRQINFTKQYQEVGVHLPLWQNTGDVVNRILVNFDSSGIRFEVNLEKVEIYADPLLEKVFYNLVDNAIRYGKTLTTIKFYFLISDKGLSLICEDDGEGIPDDYKHHIFERGVGQNTGMGLFLTREILGITRIEIEENGVYGKGARFEIIFPRGAFRFGR